MEIPPTLILGGTAVASLILVAAIAAQAPMDRRFRLRRVRSVVDGRSSRGSGTADQGSWQARALRFMTSSAKVLSIMKDRQRKEAKALLVSAGYRGRDAVVVFTFFKLVSPIAFLAGSALYLYALDPIGRGALVDLIAVVSAALLGSKLPDLIVKNQRSKRLDAIRKELPDALDMLVICAEAGLASDMALKRVVAETGRKASPLNEELQQTAIELSFLPDRRQALENLAERAPLSSVQAFANTLIQAEKYGTPLARAFKILSQDQRNERMLKAEEKAGRLPATMTVPMMLFILPALFIVLIGPAVLDIMDNFMGMEN